MESKIHRNLSQKRREYKRVVWGDFQVGEEQGVVSSADRRHREEEEKVLHLLTVMQLFYLINIKLYQINTKRSICF